MQASKAEMRVFEEPYMKLNNFTQEEREETIRETSQWSPSRISLRTEAVSVLCYSAECHGVVAEITGVWAFVFFSLAALSQSEWSLRRDLDSETYSQINWPSRY